MKKFIISSLLCLAGFCFTLTAQPGGADPVDHVDPLMGTSSPRWTLFPGVTMPAGMVKISPDNQMKGYKAGYDYNTENIAGFSHIHSRTMGGLLVMPATGELQMVPGAPDDPDAGYRSRFSHQNETARPGYYSVFLDDYGIKAELTTTARAAFQRYTFPESDSSRILLDLKIPTDNGYELLESCITKVSDREIEGFSRQRSLLGAHHNLYTLHFVVRFSKPFDTFNGWLGGDIMRDIAEIRSLYDDGSTGLFLNFKTREGETVMVQSGVSLVSIDQARLNLDRELGPFNWDFDAVSEMNRRAWNDLLTGIRVEGGSEADLRMFYTAMYRAFTGLTVWSDVNGKFVDMYEKVQEPDDPALVLFGSTPPGPGTVAINQLMALCQPDLVNSYVRSLLALHACGGWFPESSEGIEYAYHPVSSHPIPLMVSAWQKGIRDYDTVMFYRALMHDLSNAGIPHEGGGFAGKRYLETYLTSGYVPEEKAPASLTFEYAFHDRAMAETALAAGNVSDYRTFAKRAFSYRHLAKPEAGVMQTFVPHDVRGLIETYGREDFVARLEGEISDCLSSYHKEEDSDNEIKERLFSGGYNYRQSPLQAAWLFNYAGAPWLTQKWVREILSGYQKNDAPMGSAADDPAQSAALYVMSAIGLFQTDGGISATPIYEIGSPIFEKVTIRLDERYYPGGEFIIEAGNSSPGKDFIRKAKLNGEEMESPWFPHSDFAGGGRLVLKMSSKPEKEWGSSPEKAPPSMSSGMTAEEIVEIIKYDRYAEELEIWNKALRAYYYHKKEHFESLPNGENEIIFLGNSITDNAEWWELFSNTRIRNRGIGGDDTDGILERLDEVTESQPSKIFIMIGTNDLSNGKSVDYIIENYKKIIRLITASTPGTRIYIQSVIPTDDALHYTRRNSDIIAINDRLGEIAAANGITYIDLFELFRLENNKLNPEYSSDGLHLNGKGYEVWKEAIIKYVEE
jgi:predicted alpha-1,2-mannosidase